MDGSSGEMNQRSFEEQLKFGKEFEDKFAKWLIEKGWYVIPKYLYVKRGAPLLIGKNASYALPDLDCAKSGKRIWVECKRKKRMLYYPATGYPESNHNSYKKVQEITNSKIFVVFKDDEEYYGNYVDELEKCVYKRHWVFEGKEHITFKYPDAFVMINFNKKDLTRNRVVY